MKEAREQAEVARKLVHQGIDPVQARRSKRRNDQTQKEDSLTFEQVARDWHETKNAQKKPEYQKQILQRMEKHLFPVIGQVPIAQLTRSMVAQAVGPLKESLPMRILRGAMRLFLV